MLLEAAYVERLVVLGTTASQKAELTRPEEFCTEQRYSPVKDYNYSMCMTVATCMLRRYSWNLELMITLVRVRIGILYFRTV